MRYFKYVLQLDSDLLSAFVSGSGGPSIQDKNNDSGVTSTDESKDNLHGILKSPTSSSITSSASSRKLFAGADAVSRIKKFAR